MTKPSKIGFSIIGVLVLALAAGCFGSRMNGATANGTGGGGGTDVSKAAWIDKIKASGQLRVGCADSPPTTVVVGNSTCTGPDLIPMQDLADELGVKMVTVATSW